MAYINEKRLVAARGPGGTVGNYLVRGFPQDDEAVVVAMNEGANQSFNITVKDGRQYMYVKMGELPRTRAMMEVGFHHGLPKYMVFLKINNRGVSKVLLYPIGGSKGEKSLAEISKDYEMTQRLIRYVETVGMSIRPSCDDVGLYHEFLRRDYCEYTMTVDGLKLDFDDGVNL